MTKPKPVTKGEMLFLVRRINHGATCIECPIWGHRCRQYHEKILNLGCRYDQVLAALRRLIRSHKEKP
jgi:hypothetical protein